MQSVLTLALERAIVCERIAWELDLLQLCTITFGLQLQGAACSGDTAELPSASCSERAERGERSLRHGGCLLLPLFMYSFTRTVLLYRTNATLLCLYKARLWLKIIIAVLVHSFRCAVIPKVGIVGR